MEEGKASIELKSARKEELTLPVAPHRWPDPQQPSPHAWLFQHNPPPLFWWALQFGRDVVMQQEVCQVAVIQTEEEGEDEEAWSVAASKCGLDLCGSTSMSGRAAWEDHICPVLHPGKSHEVESGRETSTVADDDGWRLWFLLITPQRAAATRSQLCEVSLLHTPVFAHYFLTCGFSSSSCSDFQTS